MIINLHGNPQVAMVINMQNSNKAATCTTTTGEQWQSACTKNSRAA